VLLMLPFQATTNTVRNTAKELRAIAIQRAASNEEAQLHLAPCNSGEMTFDTTIKDARKDSKGGRKRHKQRLQEATTAAGDDVDNSKQAGGSGTMRTTAIAGSDKR
jgi:hypothetical protein